jgi:hypothetical protein
MIAKNVGSANKMGANSTASNGWRVSSTHLNRTTYFMAWNVLKEMQGHNGPTTTGEMIMKKLLAIAAMAVTFCLTGLVMSGTAFAQQCVDNGDGTVTDNSYGLMWQKDTIGPIDWYAAENYSAGLSLGGHSGWRLPNMDELLKLEGSACKKNMVVHRSYYWSNSSYKYYMYLVNFSNGLLMKGDKSDTHDKPDSYGRTRGYYARAVRAAQ